MNSVNIISQTNTLYIMYSQARDIPNRVYCSNSSFSGGIGGSCTRSWRAMEILHCAWEH